MRCARCGWPGDEATVLSTHHTSEGWVRYRRCVCGAVGIELITIGGTADEAPTRRAPVREPAPT